MNRGYTPFIQEEEVVVKDGQEMWVTKIEKQTHEVFGEEHEVTTVYFNAYQEGGEVDKWNQEQFKKDYYGN